MEDIDDVLFDKLIEEKRHKDIVHLLTRMLDNKVVLSMGDTEVILNKILRVQESLPSSIAVIANEIMGKLKSPTEWLFEVSRNQNGQIDFVVAKSK